MLSLYLCVFVFVAVLSLIAMINPQLDKKLYVISFGVMTLFLALRFGQGTDYPGYMCIYEMANMVFDPKFGFFEYLRRVHSEIGWKCIMTFFQLIKADFWILTAFIAIITMGCMHLGINRFCLKYKTFALILLYPTVYLTYYFSGMRQGLAMAIFFGILLDKLLNKKYIQYTIGVALISTIHSASLCYLMVPIIIMANKKIFILGLTLGVFVVLGMFFEPVRELIMIIGTACGASKGYFAVSSVSWFSLAERTLMLGIVLMLVRKYKHNDEMMERLRPILRIYIVGFLIYTCLMTNPFVSSRLAVMFKMSEFILIPMLFEEIQLKLRNCCFIVLLSLVTVMTYKNVDSYVEQREYYEGINGWNYPYVSIFNREDILKYRKEFINEYYDFKESDYMD